MKRRLWIRGVFVDRAVAGLAVGHFKQLKAGPCLSCRSLQSLALSRSWGGTEGRDNSYGKGLRRAQRWVHLSAPQMRVCLLVNDNPHWAPQL